ncbi:TRAP transporter substrate-binding protein [Marimonas arenosa]|uniref:TRAP transporter substrate-binding protein n=1 Tax=Marimonas arenosa TaxID=1795305 RepID=A0AAE3WBH0_9RHOB|nr:TRAP transporter substrate-binding protein [Marimonas arenosa]MDQ2090151.1 TRAP transporter substrate-binding protein [Marimonas arenosa]
MITKRKLMGLAASSAMAVALGTAAMAQEVTLKIHQFLPIQANVPKLIIEPWRKQVEEASGGKIKIDHYPSMQLGGKPPHLADQVKDGVADIVWTVLGYTPGRFPQSEVFELPFAMSNAEDTSRAFWQYAEANMLDKDFADYKIIAVHVHGPGLIHSKEPVKSIKDLNGVKLRAPTRMTNKLFTQLGATPVGMPVPAVPEALSKGVIDATVIPWEVTGALKVPELVKNHTEFGNNSLYTTTFMFAMNKDVYEGLSDELKAVIDAHSGEETSAWFGKLMEGADAPSREAAAAAGNNIMTLSEAEVQEWRDASAGIEAEWIEEMNGLGFDGQALVDQAKELITKAGM